MRRINKGWKYESARHGLAAKGVKTGRKIENAALEPAVVGSRCFNCGRVFGHGEKWHYYYHADQDDRVCAACARKLKHSDTIYAGLPVLRAEGIARKPQVGKFDDNVAERIWTDSLDSPDQQLGDVNEGFGWFGFMDYSKDPILVKERDGKKSKIAAAIIRADEQGFVFVREFSDVKEAKKLWDDYEKEYLSWLDETGALNAKGEVRRHVGNKGKVWFSVRRELSPGRIKISYPFKSGKDARRYAADAKN